MPAALETLERLAGGEDRQNALMGVAATCASVGDDETALRLIQTITLPEIRNQAWINVACSLRARQPK